jgi:hypothetical protein
VASVYPGNPPGSAMDVFTVPSNPAGTPLSEAGTGTRDLTQSIGDEGAAISSLQSWATLRTHDHSGDGTSVATGAKLAQSNTHQNADTDAAPASIHHTIDPTGTSANQVAAANHTHDYNGPSILNEPIFVRTSTTRPQNPNPGTMIWETDTNAFRVWAQFSPSNVANVGIFTTEKFNTAYATNLGPNWSQTYYPNSGLPSGYSGTSGGVMANPNGGAAQWVFSYVGFVWPIDGWPWPYIQGRCISQRINEADRHTLTDNQVLTWQAGPVVMSFNGLWPPMPSANDFYLRMNDSVTEWTRVTYTYQPAVGFSLWLIFFTITVQLAASQEIVQVYYTTNGIAGETSLGTLTIPNFNPNATFQVTFQGNTLNFFVDSNFVGKVVDSNNVTAIGASNRGWGLGMTVARDPSWALTEAHHPTYVNQIWMNDVAFYTGSPIWQLLAVGATPVCRYTQTVGQEVSNTGTILTWDTILEDTFNFMNPAVSTSNIIISEAGVYNVSCTVQIGPPSAADVMEVVLYLNGQASTLRGDQYLGAGFQQSVSFAGPMRFAENDMIQIQAFYTGSVEFGLNTFAAQEASIASTLNITFTGP